MLILTDMICYAINRRIDDEGGVWNLARGGAVDACTPLGTRWSRGQTWLDVAEQSGGERDQLQLQRPGYTTESKEC